jgi:hypothetical protein
MDLSNLLNSINEIEDEINQQNETKSFETKSFETKSFETKSFETKSFETKSFDFSTIYSVLNEIELEIDTNDDIDINQYCGMYILNNIHQYLKNNNNKYPIRFKQWMMLFNNRELTSVVINMPVEMLIHVFIEYIKYKRKPVVPKIYEQIANDALRHIEIYYQNHMKKSISLISEKNIAKLAPKYRYRIKKKYIQAETSIKILVNIGYLIPIFEYTEYGFNRLIIPLQYVEEYIKNGFEYDNTDDWWADNDDFENIIV